MIDKIDINEVATIAIEAGKAILGVYNDADFSSVVDYKSDDSPLTLADKEAHKVIAKGLGEKFPSIPLISEEGKNIAYEERKGWEYYWLVDPLDGTKEFIKRNGEFTVNIALIHNGKPVLGVVYTPVTETLYWGIKDKGAYKQVANGEKTEIKVNNKKTNLIAVQSKSHATEEEGKLLASYGVDGSISVGSSLKFCMVAEGKADIYYRHGPTMEWDTAAGHAVVEAAGGKVFKETSNEPFTYNKENLLNSSFLCLGR